MQTARGQGQHDITRDDPLVTEDIRRLDDTRRRSGDVVVVIGEQTGVLGGLAADEGRARLGAAARDARDDVGDSRGDDLAARDVVGHEQRPGADHDDVVDDHTDQVDADGVVLVDGTGDRDLGAHAIRARREKRVIEVAKRTRVEQTREAADAPEDFGTVRCAHRGLHEFYGEVACRGVYSGGGVRIQ